MLPENPPADVPTSPIEIERNFSPGLPLEGIQPAGSKLVLEVEAIERAWVLVQADRDPSQDVLLSPGERVLQRQFSRRSDADQLVSGTRRHAGACANPGHANRGLSESAETYAAALDCLGADWIAADESRREFLR